MSMDGARYTCLMKMVVSTRNGRSNLSDDARTIFCCNAFNYIHVLTFLYCQIKMLKGINHDQRNSLAHSDRHTHKYTQLKANWDLNWRTVHKECLKEVDALFLIYSFKVIFISANISIERISNII